VGALDAVVPPPKPLRLPPLRLPIRTPRLRLRLPEARDTAAIAGWFRDRRVTRPIGLWPDYSEEDARQFVRRARSGYRHRLSLSLVLTLAEDGRLIGGIGLTELNPVKLEAHLGYWVAREHWGNGYAPEAASAVCDLAFRRARLHRLHTGVFAFNPRSAAVLRRLGFVEEGRERRSFLIGGRWVDSIRFALLANEFRPYLRRAGRRKR
jgi:[ribosomal protein S5]-alanine N-acetyltransferase